MIIVKLKGGLGNQLFQYAMGRRMAHELRTELKLDTSGYEGPQSGTTIRHYALSVFNIKATLATPEEIRAFKYPYGIISKGWRFFSQSVLRRFYQGYHPEILNKKDSALYLDGYWKNEKYFLPIESIIRSDLSLKEPFSLNAEKAHVEIISHPVSVAVHFRRGDYVSNTTHLKYHGVCSPEYYAEALKRIEAQFPNAHLFIFSDDIEWVKQNIKFSLPATFVSQPEIKDYEELILMSLCTHNIIANSSFSWWSAWLNANPDKIVIAPKKWLAKTHNDYYKEIPESWIKI
jgi:hypothetical protein